MLAFGIGFGFGFEFGFGFGFGFRVRIRVRARVRVRVRTGSGSTGPVGHGRFTWIQDIRAGKFAIPDQRLMEGCEGQGSRCRCVRVQVQR
jgi:hypothetical protein